MNSLRKVAHVLETGSNEIHVDPTVINKAKVSIQRLLDFTSDKSSLLLAGDA